MTDSVSFHEMAEMELVEAAEYYNLQVRGLGKAFLREVERAIKMIQKNPESFPPILTVVRRTILQHFPYSIMYSVVDDRILILAIAHQKRRPFYWRVRK
jgi:plasmid stabilization system protein ParE